MSVIIKGMSLPKYQGEHKNFDRYGCFLTVYKNGKVELHVFENNYTIEELPTPHGRLIDADALKEKIESIYGGALWTFDCFECIRKVPTIIEAEGVNE